MLRSEFPPRSRRQSPSGPRCAISLGIVLLGAGCPQWLDDHFSERVAGPSEVDASVGGSCGALCAGAGGAGIGAGAGGASGASTSAGAGGGGTSGGRGGSSGLGGGGGLAGSGGAGGSSGGTGGSSAGTGGTGTLAQLRECPFGTPEAILGLDYASGSEWGPSLTADGLTLFFAQTATGTGDLYRATRPDRGTTFSTPVALTALNTTDDEGTPFVSANGLRLYFYSTRPDGPGGQDLYVATRSDVTAEFSNPLLLANVNSTADDYLPRLAADDLTLIFTSARTDGTGGADLWTATRITETSYTPPQLFTAINGTAGDEGGSLTQDSLVLIFDSTRDGIGNSEIFTTTRTSADASFPTPINLSVVNSDVNEYNAFLTRDERELFFSSNRTAGSTHHLFRALRGCE